MPRYRVSPGDHVEVTLSGIVVYNMGGFMAITNSVEVYERSKKRGGTQVEVTFNTDAGEYYFDIPEDMIVKDPVIRPHWPHGTLARIRPSDGDPIMVLEYRHYAGGTKGDWYDPNKPSVEGPIEVTDPVIPPIKIVWMPGD